MRTCWGSHADKLNKLLAVMNPGPYSMLTRCRLDGSAGMHLRGRRQR